jgi:glycosyltransferase involved in cell wall biosynthesis
MIGLQPAESDIMLPSRPAGCPPVTAIICALNEEKNLPYVLPEIPRWVDEVILVDGRSRDGTVEVARQLLPEIKILTQPAKGKGDALKYGVRQAKGEIIVTLDADGETPPQELENFIKPLLEGFDFTKGSRLNGRRPARMPLYRYAGNRALALTCNLLYGTHFGDICSGYNAFWKKHFFRLDLSYGRNEVGCSMEQQMIVRAKRAGLKIKEVSHTSAGRISGSSVICGLWQSLKQGIRDWLIIVAERFHG